MKCFYKTLDFSGHLHYGHCVHYKWNAKNYKEYFGIFGTFTDKRSGLRHSVCRDVFFYHLFLYLCVATTWVGEAGCVCGELRGQSKGASMVRDVLLTAIEDTCMVQFGFLATTMGARMEQDVLLTATEGVSIV